MSTSFPPGFVWGAATSSYQIEGAVAEDGRGPSIWDTFCARPGAIEDGSSGAVACDHYHRYPQDVALMKDLGLKAYRFSIAWPRILPTGTDAVPNAKGLDFYDRLVDALLEADILPWATLYHWDLPQPLEDAGGWPVRRTAHAFVDYADIVSRRLGDRVRHWITHNEPWVVCMLGYQQGEHAPGLTSWPDALAATHHVLLSHGLAVPVIRANSPGAKVGITLNFTPATPASPSEADAAAADRFDRWFNRWYLDPIFGRGYPAAQVAHHVARGELPPGGMTCVLPGDLDAIAVRTDFLGVNYYTRAILRDDTVPEAANLPRTVFEAPPEARTEMGWEVHPDSFHRLLVRLHRDYAPPALVVTENGASYATAPDASGRVRDTARIAYLHDHLAAARRAIADGTPLIGYFAWSLLDNFEWAKGYAQRFGMVWVDYATQERRLKDSARWYAETIRRHAVAPKDAVG